MSRRRYISTDISLDGAVDKLAQKYGDFAALFYTWLIPHAADDGTVSADPSVLLAMVVPRRRDKTEADIQHAIKGMLSTGLVDKSDGRLLFPAVTFYKYQTYIKEDKRRSAAQTPPIIEKRRKTPPITASLSPSLSPSPSKTTPPTPPRGGVSGFPPCMENTTIKTVGKDEAPAATFIATAFEERFGIPSAVDFSRLCQALGDCATCDGSKPHVIECADRALYGIQRGRDRKTLPGFIRSIREGDMDATT